MRSRVPVNGIIYMPLKCCFTNITRCFYRMGAYKTSIFDLMSPTGRGAGESLPECPVKVGLTFETVSLYYLRNSKIRFKQQRPGRYRFLIQNVLDRALFRNFPKEAPQIDLTDCDGPGQLIRGDREGCRIVADIL